LVITAHWGTNMSRLFIAISTAPFPAGAKSGNQSTEALNNMVTYLLDPHELSAITKMTWLVITLTLSDAMVTYRLWVVWGYKKRHTVIPLILLVLTIACHVGVVWNWATLLQPEVGNFTGKTDGSKAENIIANIFSFYTEAVLTIILSLYCMVSMAWKMTTVHKRSQSPGRMGVLPVLAVFGESALLYTVWTALFLLTVVTNSSWTFTTVDTWPAVAGISMLYISFRSGMGWYQLAPTGNDSLTPLNSGRFDKGSMSSGGSVTSVDSSRIMRISDRNMV